ncbi:hypothetical protein SEA_NICEHOUSE_254 [Rhodococcus phage NiceHouse]|nr:hypothetical protein SEA_NICEHOUSE_254 [Rhodococcus phage NiceHouse]
MTLFDFVRNLEIVTRTAAKRNALSSNERKVQ